MVVGIVIAMVVHSLAALPLSHTHNGTHIHTLPNKASLSINIITISVFTCWV